MTHEPSVTRTVRGPDVGPVPGAPVLRRLLALAVLAGFVAMHGVSTNHGVHAVAGLSGGHHVSVPVGGAPVVHGGAGGAVQVEAVPPSATAAVRSVPGDAGAGHLDLGCLVMLAASVLALVLAAIALRRTGRLPLPARAAGHLPPRRAPPRRTAPDLFALGVLRT